MGPKIVLSDMVVSESIAARLDRAARASGYSRNMALQVLLHHALSIFERERLQSQKGKN